MSAFWHMGLTVSSMERSLPFYRDVVGMEVVRGPFEGGGAGPDDLMQNPGLRLTVCWLRHGTFMFQLLEYTSNRGSTLELHHNNVGSPHLSFIVEDVDALFATISGRGDVVIASPVVDMGLGRSFYTEDPDGLPVEFWQWKDAPADPLMAIGGPDE